MANYKSRKNSENLWYHGYSIQLFPTIEQREFLDKCIDISRFIYNWAIEQENVQLVMFINGESDKKFLSQYELGRKFTELRNSNEFVSSIPYKSAANTIKRVYDAYMAFFKRTAGRPKFKSKKDITVSSYETRYECVHFDDNMLKIEGLKSWIYTKHHTGLNKKFRQFQHTVIRRDNIGNYYISFCILEKKPTEYFEKIISNL